MRGDVSNSNLKKRNGRSVLITLPAAMSMMVRIMNSINLPREVKPQRVTRTEALAEFFKARPMVWIYALDLEFAGRQAWRSRLSNLRFAPYNMRIVNRQTIIKRADGRGVFTKSEYRYEPATDHQTVSEDSGKNTDVAPDFSGNHVGRCCSRR